MQTNETADDILLPDKTQDYKFTFQEDNQYVVCFITGYRREDFPDKLLFHPKVLHTAHQVC